MFRKKTYGQSRVDKCPFCNKQATTVNDQKIPVCSQHKNTLLDEMKCICGDYLDIREGKYGIFFSCMKCGSMNMRKVFEINNVKPVQEQKPVKEKKERQIIVTTSDDPRFFE